MGAAAWCCRAGGGCRERSVILLGWRADPQECREGCVPPRGSRMGGLQHQCGDNLPCAKGEMGPWGAQQCPAAPCLGEQTPGHGGCRGSGDSNPTLAVSAPADIPRSSTARLPLAGVGTGMLHAVERHVLAGEAGDEIRMGYRFTTVGSFFEVNKTRQTIAAA